jgi:hypothetical protein
MQRLTFDDLPLQFDHLMVVHVGNAVYVYLRARSTQVVPEYIFRTRKNWMKIIYIYIYIYTRRVIHLSEEYFIVNWPPTSCALELTTESFSASLPNCFKLLQCTKKRHHVIVSSLLFEI